MLDEHEDSGGDLFGLYAQHSPRRHEHSASPLQLQPTPHPLACASSLSTPVAPFSSPRSHGGARLLSPVRVGSTSPSLFEPNGALFPSVSPSHPLLASPHLAHHSGGGGSAGLGLGHSGAAGGGSGGGGATMSAGFLSSPQSSLLPPLSEHSILHGGSPMLFDSPRGSTVAQLCNGQVGPGGTPTTPLSWKDMHLAGVPNASPSSLFNASPHSRWAVAAHMQRGSLHQMLGAANVPPAIVTEADSGAMSLLMPRDSSPPQSAASSPSNVQQSASYAQPPLQRDESNSSVCSTTSADLAAQFSSRFQLQSSTPPSQSAHSVGSELSFSFSEESLSVSPYGGATRARTPSSVTSSPARRPAAAAGLVVEEIVLAHSRKQQNDAQRVGSWGTDDSAQQQLSLMPTSKLKQHARSLSFLAHPQIGSAVAVLGLYSVRS